MRAYQAHEHTTHAETVIIQQLYVSRTFFFKLLAEHNLTDSQANQC